MYESFMRNIKNKNPAKNTIHNLELILTTVSRHVDKPLENAEWDNILGYFEYMREEEYKESTISLHKQKLKQFYLYCFDETDNAKYRKIAKKLSCIIDAKRISPLDIVYPEEVKRLINAATLERDRCIIAVLFESGIRVGELLNLRMKDVQMDEQGQEVTLHIPELPGCKTGARSVLCLEVYGYIQDWLKCHPNPSPTERFMPLSYFAIRKIVKRTYERAKIDKPTNVHMLRHSAITEAVHIGMPETQIKYRFWGNVGTVMLSVYVHLNEEITSSGYRDAKGMGNGNGTTVINPLASRCVQCGKLIQSGNGSMCKQCDDITKLSKENKKAGELLSKFQEENLALDVETNELRQVAHSQQQEIELLKQQQKSTMDWMQKLILQLPKEVVEKVKMD